MQDGGGPWCHSQQRFLFMASWHGFMATDREESQSRATESKNLPEALSDLLEPAAYLRDLFEALF